MAAYAPPDGGELMSLGERLREVRRARGWTQPEVAGRAGLSENSISRYERGDRLPDLVCLMKLAKVYEVTIDWLLLAEGERVEDVRTTESVSVMEARGALASAGPGGAADVVWEDEEIPFPRVWLREHRVSGRQSCLFRVSGDSMEPTICHGSMVLVDRGSVGLFPGRVYVLRVEDELVVKRVERAERGWWVVSDNPLWERFLFHSGMEVVGEVRWTARWF